MTGAADLVVPPRTAVEWRALIDALRTRGPAVCEDAVDADVWCPTERDDPSLVVAMCMACPVRPECAAYAIAAGERGGIWGALTPAERVAVRS